jgi:hypothetical protein
MTDINTVYIVNENDVNTILSQLPNEISREKVVNSLQSNNGNVTNTIIELLCYISREDVVKNTVDKSKERQLVDEQRKLWEQMYKDLDKYNIEKNITRVKESHEK